MRWPRRPARRKTLWFLPPEKEQQGNRLSKHQTWHLQQSSAQHTAALENPAWLYLQGKPRSSFFKARHLHRTTAWCVWPQAQQQWLGKQQHKTSLFLLLSLLHQLSYQVWFVIFPPHQHFQALPEKLSFYLRPHLNPPWWGCPTPALTLFSSLPDPRESYFASEVIPRENAYLVYLQQWITLVVQFWISSSG